MQTREIIFFKIDKKKGRLLTCTGKNKII